MITDLLFTGPAAGDINLNDGMNYAVLNGYRPAVARRRLDALRGYGPFEDAVEIIPLRVFSRLAVPALAQAEALNALHELSLAVEQAAQWYNGEPVDPVLFVYRPEGSALSTALRVAVLGYAERQDMMDLPVTFNENIRAWEINPVLLKVARHGAMLDDEISASGTGVSNPAVMTTTLASAAALPSPTRISLDDLSGTTLSGGVNGYLVLANASNKIQIYEAESGSVTVPGSGTFATAVDAAASGGSIRRLVPISAGDYILTITISSLNTSARRFLILASVRNNSGSVNYAVKATLTSKDAVDSRTKIIDAKVATPKIVTLGPISVRDTPVQMDITFTPSTTGSASDQLDVDHVDIVALDESTHIVTLEGVNLTFLFNSTLEIDHRMLSDIKPGMYEERTSTGDKHYLSYRGDISIHMTGDVVAGSIIANTYTHWRAVNSTSTVIVAALTAARRAAYLTPQ